MSNTRKLSRSLINQYLPEELMQPRGVITNLDEILETGTYQITGHANVTLIGFPPGAYRYGNLVVHGGRYFIVQEYHPRNIQASGYMFYQRVMYRADEDVTASCWRGISGTELSS